MQSELIGGPMDGDHRATIQDELFFTTGMTGYVNYYVRLGKDFHWQGIVVWRENMQHILKLDIGREHDH